jgi:protein ImuA
MKGLRMAPASPQTSIVDLRRWLDAMDRRGQDTPVLPFGISEVDSRLPHEGLLRGHLHEAIEAGNTGHFAGLATLFAAGIFARTQGPVLWCLHGRDLFMPALSHVGLHPDRVIFCETWKDRDVLPAMEEGLKCKSLAGVVGEITRLSLTASRRLQLAAAETGVMAFAIRRWRNTTEKGLAGEPNAAATRWRIAPHPSPAGGFDGMPRQLWQVELLRARGGEPHSWVLEACDATGHLALPAAMADRSVAAGEQRFTGTG